MSKPVCPAPMSDRDVPCSLEVGGPTGSYDDDSLLQRSFRRICGNAVTSAPVFVYPWVCSGLREVGHCPIEEEKTDSRISAHGIETIVGGSIGF